MRTVVLSLSCALLLGTSMASAQTPDAPPPAAPPPAAPPPAAPPPAAPPPAAAPPAAPAPGPEAAPQNFGPTPAPAAALSGDPSAPAEEAPHQNEGMKVGGIILTSVAAATLIASIPVFVVGNHKSASHDPSQVNTGNAFKSAGPPMVLGGLLLAGVGIHLWVTGAGIKDAKPAPEATPPAGAPPEGTPPGSAPPAPPPPAAKAAPMITVGLGSASLGWTF